MVVTDSLNYCHQHESLGINAFVIMPTHVHLILFDAELDVARLRRTVRDMRQLTGRKLADYCDRHMREAFYRVVHQPKRTDRNQQFWQQSRHPEAIWTQKFWQSKVDYIHDNPQRKGLVWEGAAWRFSSAAYWLLDPPGETDVVLTGIAW